MASLSFALAGVFSGVNGGPNVLTNPTSLQFGPDGRLYVSEQNGSINAFTIELQDGQYIATSHELLVDGNGKEVVKSIQNHNDQGTTVGITNNNRQVTGLVVAGTASNPVLYISSSDPQIATNGEKNLDTNSGVVSRATWNASTNSWDVVDLVRGLPRSEENHAVNGMILSADGTKLLLQVGGNTNNGAPSSFFSYTGEYVLSGSILELDLVALDALPTKIDPIAGQGGTPRAYVYDLPTLDDPNVDNITDGVGEDEFGMDEAGPWGGNDGLNMAILPADAPLRLYADGLRNPYDLAQTPNGNIYTVDNGSNANLGNAPLREGVGTDLDGDGILNEALNTPNNGGYGEGEPLFLIEEGGFYGHANPVRSNQNMSWTVYNNSGSADVSVAVNFVEDISELVPEAVNIADGYLIDPSKFAAAPNKSLADLSESERIARLLLSGQGGDRDLSDVPIALVGSSTNGIVAYDSGGAAFNGILDGKLFVTQFNDNITLLNINDAGTGLDPVSLESGPDGIFGTADDVLKQGSKSGIQEVANNLLGVPLANPLDVAVGPNGTLWVAEIGGNEITVLAPSTLTGPIDTDADDDGIDNKFDPFVRDASNGTSVVITPAQPTVWEFSQDAGDVTPGPDGFGGGVTGVMINGTTDFEQFLQSPSPRPGDIIQLDNVKFVTAAGGGTTTIEEVTSGDPGQQSNSGEFLFHTGFKLASNVDTFTVKWVVANPGAISGGSDITTDFQQIGGYLGDGTQSNFLKIVAVATNNDASQASIQVQLENNDQIVQTINIPANNIFNNPLLVPESSIAFELLIDPGAKTATPKATFNTTSGPVTITGSEVIDLADSTVLQTILGNTTVQGKSTGIAAGLFALNTRPQSEGPQSTDSFQAVFDSITVTATASNESERVVLYRVNAAGPEVAALASDPVQMAWAGNTGILTPPGVSLNTGKSSAPGIATQGRDISLPDYVPYQVFNSERWDAGALPEMEWNFAVTPGATYEVNLFLRDGFSGTSTAGQRIFDVEIEGIEFFSDIDLSASYGPQVGGMLSQQLTVADDSLDIKFLHQVQNPLINAIEIIQLPDGPPAPLPVVDIVFGDQTVNENEGTANISILSSSTVPSNETIDILFTIEPLGTATAGPNGDYQYLSSSAVFGGGVYTDTKSIAGSSSDLQIPILINNDNAFEGAEAFKFTILSVSPNAVLGSNSDATITIVDDDGVFPTPGEILFRVNAGGPEVASTDGGPAWGQDQSNANSANLIAAGSNTTTGFAVVPSASVPDTVPAELFLTERWDKPSAPSMQWGFDVAPGSYLVNLYMGNGFAGTSGADQREFDVAIEGVVPANLDDVDLSEQLGHLVGGVFSNVVDVTDGQLNIEFLHGVNNPLINAIEIIAVDDSAPIPLIASLDAPSPAGTSDAVDAGASGIDPITGLPVTSSALTPSEPSPGQTAESEGLSATSTTTTSADPITGAPLIVQTPETNEPLSITDTTTSASSDSSSEGFTSEPITFTPPPSESLLPPPPSTSSSSDPLNTQPLGSDPLDPSPPLVL